jgi:hypothetical protein
MLECCVTGSERGWIEEMMNQKLDVKKQESVSGGKV